MCYIRPMRIGEMPTFDEVLAEDLKDPAFRARWERTAVARAVAIQVIAYRVKHGLSQTRLAAQLGMTQPQVARLEAAEHNPSIDTLVRIVGVLGVELAISIRPAEQPARLVTKRAQTTAAVSTSALGDAEILVAAA
jgi:transcriptional regulator with XRE-family HTH domain